MTDLVSIQNDRWHVGVVPEVGGCVTFARVCVGEQWVDLLRPTPDASMGDPWEASSFPLIPWSNRVRRGTLVWNDDSFQLRRWGTDDFAMHGTAVEFPWEVISEGADHLHVEFDARGYYGVNFPWDFVARMTYTLEGPRFTITMSIENADDEDFPAGLGHHPYFLRSLATENGAAIGDSARLQINCEKAYALIDGMPDAEAGAIAPIDDFRTSRPVGDAFVNNCLTHRTSPILATIDYPGALTVDIEADDLLSHVATYVPLGEAFFAVEPVTNANDGFTLLANGVPGSGVFAVAPGETISTGFTLALR